MILPRGWPRGDATAPSCLGAVGGVPAPRPLYLADGCPRGGNRLVRRVALESRTDRDKQIRCHAPRRESQLIGCQSIKKSIVGAIGAAERRDVKISDGELQPDRMNTL